MTTLSTAGRFTCLIAIPAIATFLLLGAIDFLPARLTLSVVFGVTALVAVLFFFFMGVMVILVSLLQWARGRFNAIRPRPSPTK
jgi:hypothetical protein